jgi:hypothetical protein
MTTHSEQANIIEEDNPKICIWNGWRHENGADKDIIASGFIDNGASIIIEVPSEDSSLLGDSPATKVRQSIRYEARWLAPRM